MNVETFADPAALAARVATWLSALAHAGRGPFNVALSGGSTPRAAYEQLARDNSFPWDRARWFFGDERFVPPDAAQSNFRMAHEAMLYLAPEKNVHPVQTVGVTPEAAALAYETELKALRGADTLFDVTLLGLGPDGHTASLFPGSAMLDERTRLTGVVEGLGRTRVTLTYPALDDSAHVAFLVTGAEKRDVLKRVLSGDMSLPASRIRPKGELVFFVDREAAA
ncbi:MAG TPA: 6-phosphogluconolactonase [Rhizomicrobium sp.]|nr:6-phosphogluconolactonase [Rhizomicrobium sp.]